ncbi:MAG: ABC transporter permease [bacterium]
MKAVLFITWKEAKVQSRYRFVWINRSLTPFFMLAPYVLAGRSLSAALDGPILVGCLIWYWLNQYFFGLGGAFAEEREEGTMTSIALSPLSPLGFLVGRGLWLLVDCLFITAVTMILFALLGVPQGTWWLMLLLYLLCGLFMFAFSIFFAAMILLFRRLDSLNFIIQQGLGLLSGQTARIETYPRALQLVAYTFPLVYAIRLGRAVLAGESSLIAPLFLGLCGITLIYFLLGILGLNWSVRRMRQRGEWETW